MTKKTSIIPPPPTQDDLVIKSDIGTKINPTWGQWLQTVRNEANPTGQNITSAGAIDPNTEYTSLAVASGTYAVTLAAPEVTGRVKIIEMTDATGTSVTLALTNVIGGSAGTTATFNAVNETLILASISNKWVVIKEHGVTLT